MCVKRFHGRGALDRWLDRRRAESEFASLTQLAATGFPAPRPSELRACNGGFELVTGWIEGAATLDELARASKPWPAPREHVAEALGELLAAMHALGLDHPDLHAGNVLVQSGPRCTLVDVHGARLGRPLGAIRLVRDLATCAAEVRERFGPTFRARAMIAWWNALPADLRPDLSGPSVSRKLNGAGGRPKLEALAAVVEARSRERRRDVVLRSRLRWSRTSSLAASFECDGVAGVRVREIVIDRALAIARGMDRDDILSVHGAWKDVRDAWWTAARLHEHCVPAARPLVLLEEPRATAFFDAGNARPLDADAPRTRRERRRFAHDLGALVGALCDRGLVLVSRLEASVLVDPEGGARFGPGARIAAAAADDIERALDPLSSLASRASRRERALFAAAFVAARRAGRADAERIRARLRTLRFVRD